MKAALEALAPMAGRLDAVIWAGVGHGTELDRVRSLGGRQWYLEPHPALRRRIAARVADDASVSVLATALWNADGKGLFHVANDAVSSTLLAPGEAWTGRPNVRAVEVIEVETRSLATVLDGLELDERASPLLILDIGGGEEEVLAACGDAELGRLGQLLIPAGRHEAAARLQALGYEREASGEHWWLFQRPTEAPRDFEGELEQLNLQLAARAAELQELSRSHEQASHAIQALERRRADLEAERDDARAHLAVATSERDEQAALVRSLQQRLSDLERDSTAAATLREEREAETARATSLQQKLTALSQESAQTISALTRERDTAIGSLAEKSSLAEQMEAARNQLRTRLGELEAELQEARRTVALSLKLQAQRDADLEDLQARYRESQEVQERQRHLLERVGERLGLASRYFHQLADGRGKD